jgi:hypothetical protein
MVNVQRISLEVFLTDLQAWVRGAVMRDFAGMYNIEFTLQMSISCHNNLLNHKIGVTK